MEAKNKVSFLEAIPLALQHVVAMVVGCITVPLIVSNAGGLTSSDSLILVQASLFGAAIAILIQAYGKKGLGSGLPVIVGSGFAFIPTLTSIVTNYDMATVLGAQLIGACVGVIVGIFFKKIRFLFPPVVTASVVLTIGISLYKTALGNMAGGVNNAEAFGTSLSWSVSLVTLISVIIIGNYGKGVIKVSATLIGLVIGYIYAVIVGIVDFSPIANASIIALPKPLHFGLSFESSAIVAMVIIFIINSIQDIGQFEATAAGAFDRRATDQEISGGIIGNNLSGIVSAFTGGAPNATAGQNVGIVVTTGVVDKIVFIIAGAIVMITALVPKLAALFLTIPDPVLGGATVLVFGSIAMTGVRMLSNAGLSPRNLSISGLSVALAIGLSLNPGALAKTPSIIQTLFGGSPIVVVAVVAILLNFVLPKDKA